MAAVDSAHVQQLLAAGDNATSTTEKGRALEEAVCVILGCVPGLTVTERNILNAAESEEIDIVCFNDQAREGFWFLANILIVECKNWSSRVDHNAIDSFKNKLVRRKQDLGILVAANGVTGTWRPPTAAYDTIQASLREGVEIIVFTRAELETVTDTDQLCAIIKRKKVELAAYGTLKPEGA